MTTMRYVALAERGLRRWQKCCYIGRDTGSSARVRVACERNVAKIIARLTEGRRVSRSGPLRLEGPKPPEPIQCESQKLPGASLIVTPGHRHYRASANPSTAVIPGLWFTGQP